MTVTVNGQQQRLPDGESVAGLICLLEVVPEGAGVAVAVDGEVVPRSSWAEAQLHDGAHIEVVVAVQGG